MTTLRLAYGSSNRGPSIYPVRRRGHELGTGTWLVHAFLFTAMMICVVLPDIVELSSTVLTVRQIAYVVFALLMLALSRLSPARLTRIELCYLALSAVVAVTTFGTALAMPEVRLLDYLGPFSFFIGVYISAIVLPRVYRGSSESIVLAAMVTVTAAVYLGFFFRLGGELKHDNTVAAYSGVTALLLILRGMRKTASMFARAIYWSGAAVLLIILMSSMGRTSIIACLGTAYVLTWCGSLSRRRVLLLLGLFAVGFGLLLTETGVALLDTLVTKGQSWQRGEQTIATLSGRTDIWATGLRQSGLTLFGNGPRWIGGVTGRTAHSSYFSAYFAYGLATLIPWMAMCAISAWLAIACARRTRRKGMYPLGSALVAFYLIISLAEAFFSLLVGGFGMLFYLGTGMCLWMVRSESAMAGPPQYRRTDYAGVQRSSNRGSANG